MEYSSEESESEHEEAMSPTASSLDQSLSVVPFIDQAEIEELKKELPDYLARTTDLSEEFNPIEWWKLNSTTLPHWSNCAKKVLLIQPSSAAAEGFFTHQGILQ